MDFPLVFSIWPNLNANLGAYLLFVAAWVCTQALGPKFIRVAQDSYARTWLNLLIGLPVGLAAWWLSYKFALGSSVVSIGFWGVVLSIVLGFGLAGSAGLARKIGTGLVHPIDKEQPWRRTLRGGVVLGLLMVAPWVGYVALIFVISTGIGASWRSLVTLRKEKRATQNGDGE